MLQIKLTSKNVSLVVNWLLLVVIFLVPIYFAWFNENYTVFDLNKSVLFRAGLFICLTIIILFFVQSGQFIYLKAKTLFLGWIIFLSSLILSTVFSSQPLVSLWGSYERQQGLYNLGFYLIFFLLIVLFFNTIKKLKAIIMALNFSAALVCLYGLMQLFGFDFLKWSDNHSSRIFSSLGQANFLGHFIITLIPLTLYNLFSKKINLWWRLVLGWLLISELVCLFFTYSRASIIALVVMLLAAVVLLIFKLPNKKVYLSSLLLVIIFLGTVIFSPWRQKILENYYDRSSNLNFYSRALSILDFDNGSIALRLKYWQAAIKIWQEASVGRKLFGYGADTQASVFIGKYQPDWAYYEHINSFPDRVHNNLLDLLLQFGLVGVVSFGFLSFVVFKQMIIILWQGKGEKYWINFFISLALVGYAAAGFFSFALTTMSLIFYALLALAWRINHLSDFDFKTVKLFRPFSRWLIGLSIMAFLLILFFVRDVRPLIADHHYYNAKRAEARNDCYSLLDNMETVLELNPLSEHYNRMYLFFNVNCLSAATTKETETRILNNILDQANYLSSYNNLLPNALTNLGQAYAILGYYLDTKYYLQAEKYYQRLLILGPNITVTYHDYGRMKLWQADYEAARKIFYQGINIIPPLGPTVPDSGHNDAIANQLSDFYSLVGLSYKYENKFDQAIVNYNKALEIYPKSTFALRDLSEIYYLQNEIDQAIFYSQLGLAQEESNPLWLFNLANFYNKKEDFKQALYYAKLVYSLDPNEKNQLLVDELSAKLK